MTNQFKEYQERMSHNRSTLYHYFKDNGLEMRYTKINNRRYKVFIPPYKWDSAYLIVNDIRFTDWSGLIMFTNELVVRFDGGVTSSQVNIPYKCIEKIQVTDEVGVGYEELYLNK